MKGLSVNRLSVASLRHRRKAYRLLIAGIVLSIYFVCVLLLGIQGTLKASELRFRRMVGHQDAIIHSAGPLIPAMLIENGLAQQVGVATTLARGKDSQLLVGFLDDTARTMLDRRSLEGRLPEAPGELAAEASALAALRINAQVGDTITLTLDSLDRDVSADNTFILTGILAEQTGVLVYQRQYYARQMDGMPSLLVAPGQAVKPAGPALQSLLVRYAPGQNDKSFQQALEGHGYASDILTFSRPTDGDEGARERMTIALLLGISLILTGCVGIANAFQTQMQERRQQIGMMRAVGATRRQVRCIFQREALLIAVLTAPFALLLSWLTVYAVSRLAPDALQVPDQLWVYGAALAASLLMVFVSAYLPALSGARVSPMQVLRNLPAQRRVRKRRLRSQRQFRVPALMARRAAQLYPARQVGLTLIVGLVMFLAMGTAPGIRAVLTGRELLGGHVAYSLFRQQQITTQEGYILLERGMGLGQADVAQLESLPYVAEVPWVQTETVMLLLENASDYARAAGPDVYHGITPFGSRGHEVHADESLRALNPDLADALGNTRELLPLNTSIMAITQPRMRELASSLKQGSVDLENINSGQQVLLCAPTLYQVKMPRAEGYYFNAMQHDGQEVLASFANDQFAVGDRLRILQAYAFEELRPPDGLTVEYHHIYKEAVIGGIFDQPAWVLNTGATYMGDGSEVGTLITTHEGLRALGLYTDGLDAADLVVPMLPQAEAEKALTHQVEQVALRDRELTMDNRIQAMRDNAASQLRGMVSLAAVILLFMALSVSLVNSSLSSRVRAEKRTIGMLRALGANRQALGQSYRGQLLGMLLPGILLGSLACLWLALQNPLMYRDYVLQVVAVEALLLAVLTGAALLHLRRLLGRMMGQSIVDSIREL